MNTLAARHVVLLALGLSSWACVGAPAAEPASRARADAESKAAEPSESTFVGDLEPFDGSEARSWYAETRVDVSKFTTARVWMVCPGGMYLALREATSEESDVRGAWVLVAVRNEEKASRAREFGRPVPIERGSMILDEASAGVLVAAFDAVVPRTRFARPFYDDTPGGRHIQRGLHESNGAGHQFGAKGYRGRARFAGSGLAGDLARLGVRLVAVACAAPEDQSAMLEECVQLASDLRRKAERHRW